MKRRATLLQAEIKEGSFNKLFLSKLTWLVTKINNLRLTNIERFWMSRRRCHLIRLRKKNKRGLKRVKNMKTRLYNLRILVEKS